MRLLSRLLPMSLVALLLSLLIVVTVSAQDEDGRINVVHHFGGDVLYCIDRNRVPTNQYSDVGFGGIVLVDRGFNQQWFWPATDIGSAVEMAMARQTGVLVGQGQGTYGPAWLFTYIDDSGNVKFVFTGYDEYQKLNSMQFTYCFPDAEAPLTQARNQSLVSEIKEVTCPAGTSRGGAGGSVPGQQGCFCPRGFHWQPGLQPAGCEEDE